jgi:hypothetical protein
MILIRRDNIELDSVDDSHTYIQMHDTQTTEFDGDVK